MNKLNRSIFTVGAITLAGGFCSQAKADISYTISDASLEYVAVQYQGVDYNVLAGGIGITATSPTGGAPSSYVSVCTDFMGSLYLGNTYTYAQPIPTSQALAAGYNPDPSWGTVAAAAIQNASKLYANYHAALTSGNYDAAAGLQLAVWTALYDSTGANTLNTGAGAAFLAVNNGADSAAITDELSYLSALEAGTLTGDGPVQIFIPSPDSPSNGNNPNNTPPQGLLLYAPVPEASTVITATLLLLSFGMCSLKSFGKFRA